MKILHAVHGPATSAQGRAFSIVPVTILLSFATLVGAAMANVRRPGVHMRLMLVATIGMLPPAIARLIGLVTGARRPAIGEVPPVAFSLVPNLLADVLIAVAIVHEWRTRGRPHPACCCDSGAASRTGEGAEEAEDAELKGSGGFLRFV